MKKKLALLLVFVFALGMIGCGDNAKEPAEPSTSPVVEQPQKEENVAIQEASAPDCPNGIYAYENALSLEFSGNSVTLTIGTDFGIDQESVTKGTFEIDGNTVKCSFEDGTSDEYIWDIEKDTLTWMDTFVLEKTTEQITSGNPAAENNPENTIDEDLSGVQTEWMLQDGYYVAGIDIPAGTFDVIATGGIGFIDSAHDSANLRGEGYDDDYYSTSYKNFRLDKGDILDVKGVQVKITYSKILSTAEGRIYDESKAIKMTPGNYVVGKDIPAGMYNVKFISGGGGFVSSSRDNGDFIINSNMDGDPNTGEYVDFVSNILLVDGEEFEITSGLVVSFIPESN